YSLFCKVLELGRRPGSLTRLYHLRRYRPSSSALGYRSLTHLEITRPRERISSVKKVGCPSKRLHSRPFSAVYMNRGRAVHASCSPPTISPLLRLSVLMTAVRIGKSEYRDWRERGSRY